MAAARLLPAVLAAALLALACSGGVSTVNDAGADPEPEPAIENATSTPSKADGDAPTPGEEPAATAEAGTDAALSNTQGLIATTGRNGLRLVTATGEVEAFLFSEDQVSQPTWSRDGARLAATHIAAGTAAVSVLVAAAADPDAAALTAADRPYFFYSWDHRGTRLAALGPGPSGTSLDILDSTGEVVSTAPIEASSVFVAWEPDGDGLLLNVDAELIAVDDPTVLTQSRSLGAAGVPFQAPVWLGARRALAVVERSGDLVVGRLDVDDATVEDLGPATTGTVIVASPDASTALLVHSADAADDGVTTASFQPEPATEITGAVELLDLATGARQRISGTPAFWAEWSPDGAAVLLGVATEAGVRWDVWSDGRVTSLTRFVPTRDFLDSYIRFAPAYLESPRLWSPDSAAITYGAVVDGRDAARVIAVGAGSVPATVAASSVAFWAPRADS